MKTSETGKDQISLIQATTAPCHESQLHSDHGIKKSMKVSQEYCLLPTLTSWLTINYALNNALMISNRPWAYSSGVPTPQSRIYSGINKVYYSKPMKAVNQAIGMANSVLTTGRYIKKGIDYLYPMIDTARTAYMWGPTVAYYSWMARRRHRRRW